MIRWFFAAALTAVCVLPRMALAHGEPASIAVWGNYPRSISSCQRSISSAAARCIRRSVHAYFDCGPDQANCEPGAADAASQAARTAARAVVRASCSEREVQLLRYADISEAQADVINICRAVVNVMREAVLDPQGATDGEAAPLCIAETSSEIAKLVRLSMESRVAALDRIASVPLVVEEKRELIDRSSARIAEARRYSDRGSCSDESFQATYLVNREAMVASLAAQIDCFVGGVYVQDAVRCPVPVCGDRVREIGETCDDGNRDNGDGCDLNCESE